MKVGWQTKLLREVCDIDKQQGTHRDLPYVGLEHIESHTGRFIGETGPLAVKSSTFRFSPEHVLYGRLRPYLNKVLRPDFEGHCSTEIFPIRPKPCLMREFLQYWFFRDSTVAAIEATCRGARMPRANVSEVMSFDLWLPPLPEQRRIVGILDKAFEGIATAKANAEKNLENARALFESHLESVFTHEGDGWEEKTLEELCLKITDGEHIRPKVTATGVPFLSAKDVLDHDVVFTDSLFVSETDAARFRKRCNPEKGDILIVSRGATVGRTCIVNTGKTFCLLGSVILLKVRPGTCSEYLSYALKSPAIRGKLVNASEASAQQAIYLRDIKPMKVACPSFAEQKSIAARLDGLSSEIGRLASTYEQKLAALDQLKKSLLHQAFSGEL